MKSYTSIEQSKKLLELGLSPESADMCWEWNDSHNIWYYVPNIIKPTTFDNIKKCIPCWSLAALIELLPSELFLSIHYFLEISKMGDNSTPYGVRYYRFREPLDGADFGRITHISYSSQNLVDACYEMILQLHKMNLL